MKKYFSVFLFVLLIWVLVACGGSREVTDWSYSVVIGDKMMDGLFTGTIENKLPNGQGVFTFSDDSIAISYTGLWENGILVGSGELVYDGYTVKHSDTIYEGRYEGEAVKGIPNGTGIFSSTDENMAFWYSGRWKNGKIIGDGEIDTDRYKVTYSDGTVRVGKYVGDVTNGKASGSGVFTTQNDENITYTHEGKWKNGLPHGYGCRKWDSPDFYVQEGNFVEGNYVPTPLEFFVARGTRKNNDYTIIDKAKVFLKNNSDLFLTNDLSLYKGDLDRNFQYKAFAKNQSQYGDKLVVVYGTVIQIMESNSWGDEHTFCIIVDGYRNYYYVNMYGFADNVYEGNWVAMTALPLDYFTYESVSGNDVWAIACAAVSIKRQ